MKKSDFQKQMAEAKCGICGAKGQADPLYRLCHTCYSMYMKAKSPKLSVSGWPANETYWRDEDRDAIEKWKAHLRRYGFVFKRGKWLKVEETKKEVRLSIVDPIKKAKNGRKWTKKEIAAMCRVTSKGCCGYPPVDKDTGIPEIIGGLD